MLVPLARLRQFADQGLCPGVEPLGQPSSLACQRHGVWRHICGIARRTGSSTNIARLPVRMMHGHDALPLAHSDNTDL